MSIIANRIVDEIRETGKEFLSQTEIFQIIEYVKSDYKIINSGNIELNSSGNYLKLGNNSPIRMPNIDFKLLAYLIDKEGQYVNKLTILKDVWDWGNGIAVGDKVVDVAIHRLRRFIGKERILTQKKVGYKYVKNEL